MSVSSPKSFTLIELLIVTPQRKLLRSFQRGKSVSSFTLIELLIVIGILAILVAAIVITLNPAQLLQEARDSKRVQDLSSLRSAIHTAEALSPAMSFGVSSTVYVSLLDTTTTCANLGLPTITPYVYHCVTSSDNLAKTNGTGWIPIDFTQNGVVSLSALPLDPVNTTSSGLYYTYMTGGSFELTALLESQTKHETAINDGGSLPGVYEVGSNLSLTPPTRDMGLVGYWPFDEATGTIAYDRSGKGNNGTTVNGPVWTSGKVGGALSFNGVNNSVYFSSSGTYQNLTACAWLLTNTPSTLMNVLYGGGIFNYASLYSSRFGTNDGLWRLGSTTISAGGWHFVCLMLSGSVPNLGVFTNGNLEYNAPVGVGFTTGQLIRVGSYGASDRFFGGLIDDVRIYNRALSASEISALYNATK